MSKSRSPSSTVESYYECLTCGYTATTDLTPGTCPLCGDSLSSTAGLEDV